LALRHVSANAALSHTQRRAARLGQAGFTLIELAVVVTVIALLIGSILVPLSSQVDQRRAAETERILAEAREAAIGYAMVTGRLPRPAESVTNGVEKSATCAVDADCTGFIPWTTLGVSKTDAYGKIIRYSVAPAFANAPFTLSTLGNRKVQTRNGAGLVDLATGLAAVIYSHGAKRHGTTPEGVAMGDGSGTNADEDMNNANTGVGVNPLVWRVQSDNTSASGGEFDDLVVWIPVSVLDSRMVAAGKLP
jgi:prepilin-type N-terminal cleavage/methylation domain-containing protein